MFMVNLTAKKLILLFFVSFCKTFPGIDQHFPVKCLVLLLLFGVEHSWSSEIALTSVRQHIWKWTFFIPNPVFWEQTLFFKKPKYIHCFLLNSHHFEARGHFSSQTFLQRVRHLLNKTSRVTLSCSVSKLLRLFIECGNPDSSKQILVQIKKEIYSQDFFSKHQ